MGTRTAAAAASEPGIPNASICAGSDLSARSLKNADPESARMSARRAARTSVPTQLSKWP